MFKTAKIRKETRNIYPDLTEINIDYKGIQWTIRQPRWNRKIPRKAQNTEPAQEHIQYLNSPIKTKEREFFLKQKQQPTKTTQQQKLLKTEKPRNIWLHQ